MDFFAMIVPYQVRRLNVGFLFRQDMELQVEIAHSMLPKPVGQTPDVRMFQVLSKSFVKVLTFPDVQRLLAVVKDVEPLAPGKFVDR